MGPVNIERKNQERVLTVGGNILNRDLGSVVADIQEKLTEIPMPPSFSLLFSGDYEDQQESFRELMFAFVLALVLVYMVMACQFESLRDPLVVMFSVPLAGFGVILALYLTKTTFNMQSFIGCIMLAGIVVNNAILLVDTANLLRREGLPLDRAIREAGTRRLRPILMTTLTTVLGCCRSRSVSVTAARRRRGWRGGDRGTFEFDVHHALLHPGRLLGGRVAVPEKEERGDRRMKFLG